MRIYSVPIMCSPQVIPVIPESQVVGIQAPTKVMPHAQLLLTKTNNVEADPSSLVSLTCTVVELPHFVSNVSDQNVQILFECRSLIHFCDSPVNFQEAQMNFVGSYIHYFSKRKYAVYFESLTGGGGASITTVNNANQVCAVAEGTLSRGII
jgi:hypothetical protein